jgi:hypothetical protein
MNWNLTENCFLTTYHSSFMVHCVPSCCATYSSSYCAPLSPRLPSLLSLSASLQFPIDRRSSRCATANSHLPKRACRVQVDGNVVSGNQIQVLREKAKQTHTERVKRQERGTYVAFFHHLVWCFLDKERKGDSFMVDMVFFGLLLLWAFR